MIQNNLNLQILPYSWIDNKIILFFTQLLDSSFHEYQNVVLIKNINNLKFFLGSIIWWLCTVLQVLLIIILLQKTRVEIS